MSWSVCGIGKSKALAAVLAAQFDKIHCAEPEHTIKNTVAAAVAAALAAYPADAAVKVMAGGSQYKSDYSKDDSPLINTLNVTIDHVPGFVDEQVG